MVLGIAFVLVDAPERGAERVQQVDCWWWRKALRRKRKRPQNHRFDVRICCNTSSFWHFRKGKINLLVKERDMRSKKTTDKA